MKKINDAVLKKGDVVLTTSPATRSKIIRAALKSDISHAMLYVANYSVMDSTGDGVHARNIQRMFYPDDCAIYALRLKDPISDAMTDAVINYVRSITGTPYATAEAVRAITKPSGSGSQKQFCSRLIARAYASVGIKLCDNPDYCTPEELKSSPFLVHLSDPYISITTEEASVLAEGDRTEGMRKVTQNVLNGVQVFVPSVQSLQDIDTLAIQQPSLDERIAEVYKNSGYLEYWRTQPEAFPWRYEISLMLDLQKRIGDTGAIWSYCETTLQDDKNGDFDHWKINLAQCRMIFRQSGSKTFRLLEELYSNLVESHEKRVDVARTWLALQK